MEDMSAGVSDSFKSIFRSSFAHGEEPSRYVLGILSSFSSGEAARSVEKGVFSWSALGFRCREIRLSRDAATRGVDGARVTVMEG